MSYICNDLSILDLKRKLVFSSVLPRNLNIYIFSKELVALNRLIGLIRKITFYGWFMRNCVSLYIFFPAFRHMPSSLGFQLQKLRQQTELHTLTGQHTGAFTLSAGSAHSLRSRAFVVLQCAAGSPSLQGYRFSCWGRCGNQRCRLPLSPYGAIVESLCPAISLTINRAMLFSL